MPDCNTLTGVRLTCVLGLRVFTGAVGATTTGHGTHFRASWGRVEGGKKQVMDYSMSEWDSIYKKKTTRKEETYEDVTEFMVMESAPAKSGGKKLFRDDRPKPVVEFAKTLQKHANASVEENYTISATAVSQKQVDKAQAIINDISGMLKMNVDATPINDSLITLFKTIPRKMKKVNDHLIQESKIGDKKLLQAIKDQLGSEQDILDVMAGQVLVSLQGIDVDDTNSAVSDILDSLGLDIQLVDKSEEEQIKEMLAVSNNHRQFVRAFKVINKNTDMLFKKHIASVKNKKQSLLWHGSRNENWWYIGQQGLKLKPATAVITGKMFGHGTYFADKAQKSIGYTSLHGSYFARGSSRTALLGLYEVHNGHEWDVFGGGKHHTSEHSQLTHSKVSSKGYDSVFAKGGYDLRNNEFIVYDENQSNIKDLVEIGE